MGLPVNSDFEKFIAKEEFKELRRMFDDTAKRFFSLGEKVLNGLDQEDMRKSMQSKSATGIMDWDEIRIFTNKVLTDSKFAEKFLEPSFGQKLSGESSYFALLDELGLQRVYRRANLEALEAQIRDLQGFLASARALFGSDKTRASWGDEMATHMGVQLVDEIFYGNIDNLRSNGNLELQKAIDRLKIELRPATKLNLVVRFDAIKRRIFALNNSYEFDSSKLADAVLAQPHSKFDFDVFQEKAKWVLTLQWYVPDHYDWNDWRWMDEDWRRDDAEMKGRKHKAQMKPKDQLAAAKASLLAYIPDELKNNPEMQKFLGALFDTRALRQNKLDGDTITLKLNNAFTPIGGWSLSEKVLDLFAAEPSPKVAISMDLNQLEELIRKPGEKTPAFNVESLAIKFAAGEKDKSINFDRLLESLSTIVATRVQLMDPKGYATPHDRDAALSGIKLRTQYIIDDLMKISSLKDDPEFKAFLLLLTDEKTYAHLADDKAREDARKHFTEAFHPISKRLEDMERTRLLDLVAYVNGRVNEYPPTWFEEISGLRIPYTYSTMSSDPVKAHQEAFSRFSDFLWTNDDSPYRTKDPERYGDQRIREELFGPASETLLPTISFASPQTKMRVDEVKAYSHQLAIAVENLEASLMAVQGREPGLSRADLARLMRRQLEIDTTNRSRTLGKLSALLPAAQAELDDATVTNILKFLDIKVSGPSKPGEPTGFEKLVKNDTIRKQIAILAYIYAATQFLLDQNMGSPSMPSIFDFMTPDKRVRGATVGLAQSLTEFSQMAKDYGFSAWELNDAMKNRLLAVGKESAQRLSPLLETAEKSDSPLWYMAKSSVVGLGQQAKETAMNFIAEPFYRYFFELGFLYKKVGDREGGGWAALYPFIYYKVALMGSFLESNKEAEVLQAMAHQDDLQYLQKIEWARTITGFSPELLERGNEASLYASWFVDAAALATFGTVGFGSGGLTRSQMGREFFAKLAGQREAGLGLVDETAVVARSAQAGRGPGIFKRTVTRLAKAHVEGTKLFQGVDEAARKKAAMGANQALAESGKKGATTGAKEVAGSAAEKGGVTEVAEGAASKVAKAPLSKPGLPTRLLSASLQGGKVVGESVGFAGMQLGAQALIYGEIGQNPQEMAVNAGTSFANNLAFFAALWIAQGHLLPIIAKGPVIFRLPAIYANKFLGQGILFNIVRDAARNTAQLAWDYDYRHFFSFRLKEEAEFANLERDPQNPKMPKFQNEGQRIRFERARHIKITFLNNLFLFGYMGGSRAASRSQRLQQYGIVRAWFPDSRIYSSFDVFREQIRSRAINGDDPESLLDLKNQMLTPDKKDGKSPLLRDFETMLGRSATKGEIRQLEELLNQQFDQALKEGEQWRLYQLGGNRRDAIGRIGAILARNDLTTDQKVELLDNNDLIPFLNLSRAGVYTQEIARSRISERSKGRKAADSVLGKAFADHFTPEEWNELLDLSKAKLMARVDWATGKGADGEAVGVIRGDDNVDLGLQKRYNTPEQRTVIEMTGMKARFDFQQAGDKAVKVEIYPKGTPKGSLFFYGPGNLKIEIVLYTDGTFSRLTFTNENGRMEEFRDLRTAKRAFDALGIKVGIGDNFMEQLPHVTDPLVSEVSRMMTYKNRDGKKVTGQLRIITYGKDKNVREIIYPDNTFTIEIDDPDEPQSFKDRLKGFFKSVYRLPFPAFNDGRAYTIDARANLIHFYDRNGIELEINTKTGVVKRKRNGKEIPWQVGGPVRLRDLERLMRKGFQDPYPLYTEVDMAQVANFYFRQGDPFADGSPEYQQQRQSGQPGSTEILWAFTHLHIDRQALVKSARWRSEQMALLEKELKIREGAADLQNDEGKLALSYLTHWAMGMSTDRALTILGFDPAQSEWKTMMDWKPATPEQFSLMNKRRDELLKEYDPETGSKKDDPEAQAHLEDINMAFEFLTNADAVTHSN